MQRIEHRQSALSAADPLEEVRRRRLIIDRLDAWLYDEIAPYLGQRVLEIGAGHGNLVPHLLDRELVVASDSDPSSLEVLRGRYGAQPNVRVCLYDVCRPAADELRGYHLDTVISLNVLEHIQDDQAALSHMADLLSPGGRVLAVVPAHPSLYGSMDSSIGHHRRYTRQSMAHKLDAAGLSVEALYYLNLLGALGWLVNGRLLRQTVPPSGQLGWFNRLVPAVSWIERRVRPPAGISLVAVARRGHTRP